MLKKENAKNTWKWTLIFTDSLIRKFWRDLGFSKSRWAIRSFALGIRSHGYTIHSLDLHSSFPRVALCKTIAIREGTDFQYEGADFTIRYNDLLLPFLLNPQVPLVLLFSNMGGIEDEFHFVWFPLHFFEIREKYMKDIYMYTWCIFCAKIAERIFI